jgi:hypothetical protein
LANKTYNWTGAGDGVTFSDPTNWDLNDGTYPVDPTDSCLFPVLGNPAAAFTLDVDTQAVIELDEGSLDVSGRSAGDFALYGGTLHGTTLSAGTINMDRAAALTNSGNTNYGVEYVNLSGRLTLSGDIVVAADANNLDGDIVCGGITCQAITFDNSNAFGGLATAGSFTITSTADIVAASLTVYQFNDSYNDGSNFNVATGSGYDMTIDSVTVTNIGGICTVQSHTTGTFTCPSVTVIGGNLADTTGNLIVGTTTIGSNGTGAYNITTLTANGDGYLYLTGSASGSVLQTLDVSGSCPSVVFSGGAPKSQMRFSGSAHFYAKKFSTVASNGLNL